MASSSSMVIESGESSATWVFDGDYNKNAIVTILASGVKKFAFEVERQRKVERVYGVVTFDHPKSLDQIDEFGGRYYWTAVAYDDPEVLDVDEELSQVKVAAERDPSTVELSDD